MLKQENGVGVKNVCLILSSMVQPMPHFTLKRMWAKLEKNDIANYYCSVCRRKTKTKRDVFMYYKLL
jgi:hypothetical protein